MQMNELRYEISDWHQLPQCKSNTSNDLSIEVSDIIDEHRLSALRITVHHKEFGDLYTVLVNARGSILNEYRESTPETILENLSSFGFIVRFSQREHLPGNVIQKLMTLNTLGFDKIRPLNVHNYATGRSYTYIVAFMITQNPDWLSGGFEASWADFTTALNNGSAINLSTLSYMQGINWSWLDYVASISDIIGDNT